MINETVVELSRLQFAATALYHFLFVPLTLGLSFLLAAMETVYFVSNRQIYKEMTRFWSKLFLINFALGVATGLTMEFQFGTNWSFYSTFVGDTFGAPLAIEGLMAFFMESTFVGLMIFGWERLTKAQHLITSQLVFDLTHPIGKKLKCFWVIVIREKHLAQPCVTRSALRLSHHEDIPDQGSLNEQPCGADQNHFANFFGVARRKLCCNPAADAATDEIELRNVQSVE